MAGLGSAPDLYNIIGMYIDQHDSFKPCNIIKRFHVMSLSRILNNLTFQKRKLRFKIEMSRNDVFDKRFMKYEFTLSFQ